MTCITKDDRNVVEVKELLPWVKETPVRDILDAPEEKLYLIRMMKEGMDERDPPLDLPEELQGIVKTKSLTGLMEGILQ